MPTPAAVIPPTAENIALYRAAASAWRDTWRIEHVKDKLANPHVPLEAATAAVRDLAPEMTPGEARNPRPARRCMDGAGAQRLAIRPKRRVKSFA
jgi:hypothetical protein